MTPFGCSTVTRPPVEPKRPEPPRHPDGRRMTFAEVAAIESGKAIRDVLNPQASKSLLPEGTRQEKLIQLLRVRPYSVSELMNLFGSTSAAQSLVWQVRRKGFDIACEQSGKGTRYRLISEPEQ